MDMYNVLGRFLSGHERKSLKSLKNPSRIVTNPSKIMPPFDKFLLNYK
jgi:hypothetical protein